MTFEQEQKAQKIKPKKIIINFYADWCESCKKMEKEVYNHPVIQKHINENFYAVKFNSEGNETVNHFGKTFVNPKYNPLEKEKNSAHQFTQFMNVSSVPSLVFLDEKGNPITILNGTLTAKEIEPYLMLISTDAYQKFKTREEWDNYQRKFKSKIKE